eukprot:1021627-Amorphochlora_amoeboformis.AAC.2
MELGLPAGPPALHKTPSLNRSRSGKELTEDQIKEYKEAWKLFDLDGDGFITCDELEKLMQSTGQTTSKEELKEIIAEADQDG